MIPESLGRALFDLIPDGIQLTMTATRDGGISLALIAGFGCNAEYLPVAKLTAQQLASRTWVEALRRDVTKAVLAFCEYPERVLK